MKRKLSFVASLLALAPLLHAAVNVSVLSYGAKGDGVTDDTAAIQNASTAVANAGGQLFFPAGTYMINPNRGHLVLGSNMTVYGTGVIRVEPNTGNFEYVVGPDPYYKAISNVTIQNITVDTNVLNNPSTVAATDTQAQDVLAAVELTGLTLTGVTFNSSGIYAVKINDKLTMSNSTITFQSRSDNPWYDNSSIYIPAQHSTCSITNNTFSGGTQAANNAIEVHYTQNCVISGNKFDNYRGAVLPLDSYSLTISNNTITRANYAISLWSETLVQNVSILSNNISLNNKDRQTGTSAGIAFYWCSYCTPNGNFDDITIEGNTISFQTDDNRTSVSPSAYWGIGVMPAGNVTNVTIMSNTVINTPISGITVGNGLYPNSTSNVIVEKNTIINPGTNTDETPSEAGIELRGKLNNVTVSNNAIVNQASPFTGKYGIWADPGGHYSSVTVSNNQISPVYINVLGAGILQ